MRNYLMVMTVIMVPILLIIKILSLFGLCDRKWFIYGLGVMIISFTLLMIFAFWKDSINRIIDAKGVDKIPQTIRLLIFIFGASMLLLMGVIAFIHPERLPAY